MGKKRNLGKITNSTLAVFTVLCGFVMMWASSLGGSSTRSSVTQALEQAIDIDADRPSPLNNGKLVVAAGKLRGDPPLEDDFLHPQPVVRLKRHVEMLQWVESREEGADPSAQLRYSLEWASREVDFFQFREPTGHENPIMKIQPTDMKAPTILFGLFNGARIVEAITELKPLELKPELLKDPSIPIENNKLLIKREPGVAGLSLGDMRVWYSVLPAADYTVMTEQADEVFLLKERPSGRLLIQLGRYSVDELYGVLAQGAKEAYTGMLVFGALIMAFGLVSALKPHAERFDLNPKIDVQGMPAVVLVSIAISAAVMAIFMVLSLAG
jgi:hypothetical protein